MKQQTKSKLLLYSFLFFTFGTVVSLKYGEGTILLAIMTAVSLILSILYFLQNR